MDERWSSVVKKWLTFPEEIGAVFTSPGKAEVWKGTATQCPYFKKYQKEKVVVVHSHPPSPNRKYSPPSSTDLLNCIVSPNPHIVIAEEGFWVYSPTTALQEEWTRLSLQQQDELGKIITNVLEFLFLFLCWSWCFFYWFFFFFILGFHNCINFL